MTTGTPQPMDPRQPGDRPGGASARRGPSLLPLLLVGWVLLEIWLLILLADAAGGLAVVLLLVGGLLVGGLAVKRAGRRAWQRLSESIQQQQAAARGVPPEPVRTGGGNGLTMLGGVLLIIPGVLVKVAGLLCVLPPTAALIRAATRRSLASSVGPLGTAYTEARQASDTMRARRPDGRIVPGEVVDHPADGDVPPGRPDVPGDEDGPTGRPGRG